MKRKFLLSFVIFLILNSSFLSKDSMSQWVQRTNGISGTVNALGVSGTNIFAGVYLSGVYLSTNNGVSWTAAGMTGQELRAFAVLGTKLFVATGGAGIYFTTNNGTNWSAAYTGITNLFVSSFAVSGTNIFAANYAANPTNEVYLSTNSGTNWTAVSNGLPGEHILSLAALGSNLFAGLHYNIANGGVYRTTNNGANWTSVGLLNLTVRALAVSGSNLFAGVDGGVLLSTNNGTNWITVNNGLTNTTVYSLAVSGTNIFAGTAGGVFLSTNNGTNWTAKNEGFSPLPYVYSLLTTTEFIYTGTWGASVWSRSLTEILPVELVSFTSTVDHQNVLLNWTTSQETNNAGFEIERKNSGVEDWSKLSFVKGAGSSTIPKIYTFEDRNLEVGKYQYRLKQIDFNGNLKYYDLANEVVIGVPQKFNLRQNYPNPFNPMTKINYEIPIDSKVSIKLYDMTGREVVNILNVTQPAGYYSIQFNGSSLASGIYFYRINASEFVDTKRMVLVK